jgi:hypothetical protein
VVRSVGSMSRPHAGDGAPWFAFWAVRWINSPDVQNMNDSERGIYIQILTHCWVFGELTRDPWKLSEQLHTRYASTTQWLRKYATLVVDGQSGSSHFAVPKLDELQDLLEKSSADAIRRVKESKGKETKTNNGVDVPLDDLEISKNQQGVGPSVPTQTPKPNPAPSPSQPFNPLEYAKTIREEAVAPESLDADLLVQEFIRLGGHYIWKDRKGRGQNSDLCAKAFAKLLDRDDESPAHVLAVMEFMAQSPMYSRGAKTITEVSPWDWFAMKFDQITASMEADDEYSKKLKLKIEQDTQRIVDSIKERKAAIAGAKVPSPTNDPDPLWKLNPNGSRAIARKPKSVQERRELLALRDKPRIRWEYVAEFLSQDGCATCDGTNPHCECAEKEELV